MFDSKTTVQEDLRGGKAPWLVGAKPTRAKLEHDRRCEILVVGGGITGSLMAEHLTALGHQVCLIDRERPGFGSTAASTAMLQWEIDCSLGELTQFYGFDRAANIYRHSLKAVGGLKALVDRLQLHCAFRHRNSLYLASGDTGAVELQAEYALRERAGMPGLYIDYPTLRRDYGFEREAAILSPGSADADPLCLTHGLLAVTAARGVIIYDAEAVSYDSTARGVTVGLDDGRVIEAERVVLATGYVMPDFVKTDLHKTASSWAIATPRQGADARWPGDALIWEASEDYHYLRTTGDNRIIIGGEDDDEITEPTKRDNAMPKKAEVLLDTLKHLAPKAEARAEFIWSGAFGETLDGLPLIGQVPGHPRLYAAYGYGGNGITFSYMASRLIGRLIAGHHEIWYDDFAIARPLPGT